MNTWNDAEIRFCFFTDHRLNIVFFRLTYELNESICFVLKEEPPTGWTRWIELAMVSLHSVSSSLRNIKFRSCFLLFLCICPPDLFFLHEEKFDFDVSMSPAR